MFLLASKLQSVPTTSRSKIDGSNFSNTFQKLINHRIIESNPNLLGGKEENDRSIDYNYISKFHLHHLSYVTLIDGSPKDNRVVCSSVLHFASIILSH